MLSLIIWAQNRAGQIFISYKIGQPTEMTVEVVKGEEHSTVKMHAVVNGEEFDSSVELYGLVKEEGVVSVTGTVNGREVTLNREGGYWPRLSTASRLNNVSVNWDKWEDEEDDTPADTGYPF